LKFEKDIKMLTNHFIFHVEITHFQ